MDEGLRERKKRATRRRLIAAAAELAERHDVDDVTVADIAEAAGVSRRTFFNYFSRKEEALVGAEPERTRHLAELLAARPAAEPPWTAMRRALVTFYDTTDDPRDRSAVARLRLARAHPSLVGETRAWFAELEHAMAAVIAERLGEPSTALRPHLLVALAMTTIRVAIDDWLAGDDDTPLPDAVDAALALVGDDLLHDQPTRTVA